MPRSSTFSVTIANGGTVSGAVDLGSFVLCGILLPAAFTGVALTFQTSDAVDGTYVSVRDGAGAALTKTVAQAQYIPIDPKDFHGVQFLKVVSGSAEGAARVVKLVGRIF